MIRPISMLSILLALGSGLYLYQSKHEAQVLDRQIEKTIKETEQLRDQTRVLHAEWTLLNDPERLRQFADQYLALKPVAPAQFTSLADLATRLPAVRVPEPERPVVVPIEGGSLPVAIVAPAPADPLTDVEEEILPLPPRPVAPPASMQVAASSVALPPSPPPERKPPAQKAVQEPPRPAEPPPPRPVPLVDPRVLAAARTPEPRLPEPRAAEQRAAFEQRPAAPAPRPVAVAVAPHPVPQAPSPAPVAMAPPRQLAAAPPPPAYNPPASYGGSLLGGAHGSVPAPLPRPMPVNATYGN